MASWVNDWLLLFDRADLTDVLDRADDGRGMKRAVLMLSGPRCDPTPPSPPREWRAELGRVELRLELGRIECADIGLLNGEARGILADVASPWSV